MGEKTDFTKWWVLLVALVVVTAIIVGFGWLKFGKKVALDYDRQAIKHSLQYTESIRSEVNTLVMGYQDLNSSIEEYRAANADGKYDKLIDSFKAQQEGIIRQIKHRVKGLPVDTLPPEVKHLVSQY